MYANLTNHIYVIVFTWFSAKKNHLQEYLRWDLLPALNVCVEVFTTQAGVESPAPFIV
jgi:hypothetical protein